MTKIIQVTDEQYVADLNHALRRDADYVAGMRYYPVPRGARRGQMSGCRFTWRAEWLGVYARVASAFQKTHKLKLP